MADPAVTFNPTTFKDAYPEFAACTTGQLTAWFTRASFLCGNEACNPVNAVTGMLESCLWLLTAHIGWLNAPRDANGNPAASGQPASPIVGRVNTASEGSVSVGADMGEATAGSPSQPWYMQTKYGAEYWAATAPVRTARYVAQPSLSPQPWYPGGAYPLVY
jgi:hypothetical protein